MLHCGHGCAPAGQVALFPVQQGTCWSLLPGNSSECPPPGNAEDDTVCLDLGKCKDGKCIPFCEREQQLESCACNGECRAGSASARCGWPAGIAGKLHSCGVRTVQLLFCSIRNSWLALRGQLGGGSCVLLSYAEKPTRSPLALKGVCAVAGRAGLLPQLSDGAEEPLSLAPALLDCGFFPKLYFWSSWA